MPKSNTEGFVPAELLELPCERQARINSRINVRLSVAPQPTVRFKADSKAKKRVHFNFELQLNPSELTSADILEKLPQLPSHTTTAVDNTPVTSTMNHVDLDKTVDKEVSATPIQPVVA